MEFFGYYKFGYSWQELGIYWYEFRIFRLNWLYIGKYWVFSVKNWVLLVRMMVSGKNCVLLLKLDFLKLELIVDHFLLNYDKNRQCVCEQFSE